MSFDFDYVWHFLEASQSFNFFDVIENRFWLNWSGDITSRVLCEIVPSRQNSRHYITLQIQMSLSVNTV